MAEPRGCVLCPGTFALTAGGPGAAPGSAQLQMQEIITCAQHLREPLDTVEIRPAGIAGCGG